MDAGLSLVWGVGKTSIETPSLHTQEGGAGPRLGCEVRWREATGEVVSGWEGCLQEHPLDKSVLGELGPQEAWERLTPDSADLSCRE